MTLRNAIAVAVSFVLAALAALGGARASPLDDLIAPKGGNSACFIRVYDADHLRKHPQQNITAITVWLRYAPDLNGGPDLGIAVRRRGKPEPLFAQGGCAWGEHANRDTSDRRMLKEFKKEAGAGCMMLARPEVFDVSSAEEGGFLILDRGKDANTMLVYLDAGLVMVKRVDRAKQLDIDFGTDDRVFLLHRADPEDCAAVEDALTTPERAKPRR